MSEFSKFNQFTIKPSTRKDKKFMVILENSNSNSKVHFGAAGYEDYTIHKDPKRKASYIARHAPREDWSKRGIGTAGYWSRHILWEKPTLIESIKALEKKHNISINIKI